MLLDISRYTYQALMLLNISMHTYYQAPICQAPIDLYIYILPRTSIQLELVLRFNVAQASAHTRATPRF